MKPNHRVYLLVVFTFVVAAFLSEPRKALADGHVRLSTTPEVELAIGRPLSSVAFSPDQRCLAAADFDRGIYLWNWKSREKAWQTELPPVGAVAAEKVALTFTADGKSLLLASYVRNPLVLDASSGKTLRILGEHGEWFAPAISLWCKDGTETAATSSNGDIHLWNVSNGNKVMALNGAGQKVILLQVAKNAARIALGLDALGLDDNADTGRVLVRELPSGRILFDVRQSQLPVRQIAISPNGECLIGASEEGLACWSISRKERLWSRKIICGGLAMSPDGKMFACGIGSQVALCDVSSGVTISSREYGSQAIGAVAFDAGGAFIAVGREDGAIAVWRVLP